MIDQLTVFLENSKGRLTAMCKTLGDAGINMHALTVADTADYGIARIICDKPDEAAKALKAANFTASTTKVVGVKVTDKPGSVAGVFAALEAANINVEYCYCFAADGNAMDALKAPEAAIAVLQDAGYETVSQADIA